MDVMKEETFGPVVGIMKAKIPHENLTTDLSAHSGNFFFFFGF